MLVRFVVENLFSFGERKEFNTIPNNRLKTLCHHKYNIDGFNILKTSSIYGANGSGKSNLVNSIKLFQQLILNEEIPFRIKDVQFKFNSNDDNKKQIFAIEFIQEDTAFYYGIELIGDCIATEELYLSGLGKNPDELIFERKTNNNKITSIQFLADFENDEKSQLLKSILLEEFVKHNEPILKLISKRENKFLKNVKKAFRWFDDTLQIITPDARPTGLALRIDKDKKFKQYAEDTMCAFNLGITSLTTEKKDIKEFFGEEDPSELKEFIKKVDDSENGMIGLRSNNGNEIVLVKENDKVVVLNLKIGHTGQEGKSALFELEEESDGTVRLLDFIPAFQDLTTKNRVFIIDEIERSIHPLLIKEVVKKFSLDEKTKGQLIFTTHESNLLDQELFRQDEIWFAEKDSTGNTDLYSLSDFKEHKTIDIRKGYLNGRYGSIPFLANLKDLNWHDYDTHQ